MNQISQRKKPALKTQEFGSNIDCNNPTSDKMRLKLLATVLATSFLSFSLLTGCSTPYPLNMSKEQWQQLSKDQQTQLLLEEQKNRAEQAKAQQIADNRARELRLQAEISEQKRLEKLYANPAHGGVLRVNIEGGQWIERKKTYQIQADSFRIARGEKKQIELSLINSKGYHYRRDVWVEYRMDGDAIYLKEHRYDDNQMTLLNRNQWACGDYYRSTLKDSYQIIKIQVSVFESGRGVNCRGYSSPHHRIPPMR